MNSVWSATASIAEKEPLKQRAHTDVLIIGGGMAGILCAYQMQQARISYLLVEADTICSGITKNTTAKITAQHGLIYHQLLRQFGTERAQMYLRANEAALAQYRQLCRELDCDFETRANWLMSCSVSRTFPLRKIRLNLASGIPLAVASSFCVMPSFWRSAWICLARADCSFLL